MKSQIAPVDGGFVYRFTAMASPCEIRVETPEFGVALEIGERAEAEAIRIEHKFSRYRSESVISRVNQADGAPVQIDEETANLIDYAAHCHAISKGRFDITTGVLRRLWRFDGSENVPTAAEVKSILPSVGWRKVSWRRPVLTLPVGMEIDFGGFGKEYAVDRAMSAAQAIAAVPILINFGGDLRVSGPKGDGGKWRASIESVEAPELSEAVLEIRDGALTTSGDARRFLMKAGVRYSHILDPRTGWPVANPPRSVTVAAPTCIEAGLLSTLAMLHGAGAERFLKKERITAWCIR